MSKLILTKITQPKRPTSGKVAIYVDTADNRIKSIDSTGVVSQIGSEGAHGNSIIHNGGFRILQRQVPASTAIAGVSTTTRAGQVADRWAVTSTVTGATISFQQVENAGIPNVGLNARYYGSIIVATTARKVMLSQVILSSDMSHLRGKKVRVSIKTNQKVGAVQTYSMGLLQLTNAGTVDVMPAFLTGAWKIGNGVDPDWGTNLSPIPPDTGIEGENCRIGPTWAHITTRSNVAGNNLFEWQRSSAVFTIPTGAKNLVFVLFQEVIGATTDNFSFSEAQITEGGDIIDYVEPPLAYEMWNCQRFFCKSFPYAITPAVSVSLANGGYGTIAPMVIAGNATALGTQIPIYFPVTMWKVPAITYYTPTSTGALIMRHTGTTPVVQGATATVASTLTAIGCTVASTNEASANTVVGNIMSIHWSVEADFIL